MRADEVECATCSAAPGRPCLRPGGSTLSTSHHRARLRSEGLELPCDECGVEAGYLCRDDDDAPLARVCAGSVRDTAPKAEPTHGTIKNYNAGCRCDSCVAIKRAYNAKQKARLKATPVPAGKHGTYVAYEAYGCRCDPCRAAGAARWRRRQ